MSRPRDSALPYEPPRLLRSYTVEELLRGATDVFLITGGWPKPQPGGPEQPQAPLSQGPDATGAGGDDLI